MIFLKWKRRNLPTFWNWSPPVKIYLMGRNVPLFEYRTKVLNNSTLLVATSSALAPPPLLPTPNQSRSSKCINGCPKWHVLYCTIRWYEYLCFERIESSKHWMTKCWIGFKPVIGTNQLPSTLLDTLLEIKFKKSALFFRHPGVFAQILNYYRSLFIHIIERLSFIFFIQLIF